MTDELRAIRRVALRCPRCGGDLDGLASDRVFGCRPCARALSVEADGLREDELLVWEGERDGPVVHLPIWVFGVRAEVVLPPVPRTSLPPGVSSAERRVPFRGRRVYVAAFDVRGRATHGDPGMNLTRRQPEPHVRRDANPPPLAGAVLVRSDAERVVEAEILAVIDTQTDVFGGHVDLQVDGVYLALAPFAEADGGAVREPLGGLSYAAGSLPDLDAVREAQGRAG